MIYSPNPIQIQQNSLYPESSSIQVQSSLLVVKDEDLKQTPCTLQSWFSMDVRNFTEPNFTD